MILIHHSGTMPSLDPLHRSITNSDGSSFEETLPAPESTDSRDDDEEEKGLEECRVDSQFAAESASAEGMELNQPEETREESQAPADTRTAPSKRGQLLLLLQSPSPSVASRQVREQDTPGRDDASFALFGQSFDFMCDNSDINETFRSSPPSQRHSDVDISLPALTHSRSMTDISPIKLDMEAQATDYQDGLEPLALQFSNHRDNDEEANYKDHQQDTQHWERSTARPLTPPPRTFEFEQSRSYATATTYSNPVYVLRSCRPAFACCNFLLSHVRKPNPLSVHFSGHGAYNHYQNQANMDSVHYDPEDLLIACRRVKTAICAFGGSSPPSGPAFERQGDRNSIFRGIHRWDQQYDERLHKRYHVQGGHISWELEENPPIHVAAKKGISQSARAPDSPMTTDGSLQLSPDGSSYREGTSISTVTSSQSHCEQPKLKYRCKLCGQPKQNHKCPYQRSIQRSIGVSVYPALNAYIAVEPGRLAPALSEMNNFVDRALEEGVAHLTSESSPQSQQLATEMNVHSPNPVTVFGEVTPPSSSGTVPVEIRKRKHSDVANLPSQPQTPFSPYATPAQLCHEQYRAVLTGPAEGDFDYANVPISFAERKRLSDTLFFMSREIPHLTAEVASILHEAREREMWDQAVAELMTQLVVSMYCGEGDKRLDGLQQYLMRIGIAC